VEECSTNQAMRFQDKEEAMVLYMMMSSRFSMLWLCTPKSHNGALPDASHLLANLTFDKTDANEEKLTDKIRKLRARYRRSLSHGCPSGGLSRQLFKLSKIL
jgi:hypothetical protein